MNVFHKITENPIKALQEVFISTKMSDFISVRTIPKASESETKDFLQRFPVYRYLLCGQYFYRKACGANHGIHTDIAADTETAKTAVSVCKYLFRKVQANTIELDNGATAWLIVVSEVSDEGRRVAETTQNKLLEELYIHASITNEAMPQGIYEVVGNSSLAAMQDGDFLSALENPYFRTMDVSSLSGEECANSPLIAYIATHKTKACLSIIETNGRLFQILYWK